MTAIVKSKELKITDPIVFYFLTFGFTVIAFMGNIPLKVIVPVSFLYFFILVFEEKIKTKNILLNVLIFFILMVLCEGIIFCYSFFPIFFICLLLILFVRSI